MTSKYDRYSKEELVRIIEERDRKPKFGLVYEQYWQTEEEISLVEGNTP